MAGALSSPLHLSRRAKALLLSPFVILIAAAVRLIVISNGDTTVATTLANARGVTGSLLGTVIPLIPPYLPLLVLFIVLFRRTVLAMVMAGAALLVSPAYDSGENGLSYVVSSVPDLFTLALDGEWKALLAQAPSVLVCVAVGVVFAFWGVSDVSRRAEYNFLTFVNEVKFVAMGIVYAAICTTGLLFIQAVYKVPFDFESASQIARRPWLPAEEVHTDGGQRYVGYIISTNDGWFLLMNEHDRALKYIKDDSVVARQVCTPSSYRVEYRPPLIRLWGAGRPSAEACGEPTSEQPTPEPALDHLR